MCWCVCVCTRERQERESSKRSSVGSCVFLLASPFLSHHPATLRLLHALECGHDLHGGALCRAGCAAGGRLRGGPAHTPCGRPGVCVCVCVCVAVTVAVHVSTSRRTLLISSARRTMSRRRSAPPVRPGTYSVRAATAALIFSLPLLPSARAHAVYVFLCLSLFSRTSRTHRTSSAAAIASESVPLLPFHPSVAATRRERALTLLRCVCVCVCVCCVE